MNTLGERLQLARKEFGLSQPELAHRAGVTQPTISDLETGKTSGSTDIVAIAAVLQVQPLWLVYGRGPKKHEGPVYLVHHDVPQHLLKLAEKLLLLTDDKLKALSVLLGIRL